MRVIDLLNRMTTDEEMPKTIKVCGEIYQYNTHFKDYKARDIERTWLLSDFVEFTTDLTEEVEIIEDIPKEDKKIEKFYFSVYQDQKLGGREVVEPLETKINEIIDKINGE